MNDAKRPRRFFPTRLGFAVLAMLPLGVTCQAYSAWSTNTSDPFLAESAELEAFFFTFLWVVAFVPLAVTWVVLAVRSGDEPLRRTVPWWQRVLLLITPTLGFAMYFMYRLGQ